MNYMKINFEIPEPVAKQFKRYINNTQIDSDELLTKFLESFMESVNGACSNPSLLVGCWRKEVLE